LSVPRGRDSAFRHGAHRRVGGTRGIEDWGGRRAHRRRPRAEHRCGNQGGRRRDAGAVSGPHSPAPTRRRFARRPGAEAQALRADASSEHTRRSGRRYPCRVGMTSQSNAPDGNEMVTRSLTTTDIIAPLDAGTRAIVRLAGAVASLDEGGMRPFISVAAVDAPHSWVEEVLLQSYLFAGFPRTLNA